MATVTVIIPTFNRKELLLEALKSVLAQTYGDYEVIVVDDGSTDGTEETVALFADRVRYLFKPNGGEASARNCGIQNARTKYVAFLDSDDLWEPIFLETTVNHLERNPSLGLVSTVHSVIPGGRIRPKIGKALLQGDLFPHLLIRNFITVSGVLLKYDCFQEVGLFSERLDQATDYDMWLRTAKIYPIAVLNSPLCYKRSHSGNVSRHELRHRQCVLQVVQSHFDQGRISRRAFRRRRSRLEVSLGRAYAKAGHIKEAEKCFRRAIALAPFRFRPWWQLVGNRASQVLNNSGSHHLV